MSSFCDEKLNHGNDTIKEMPELIKTLVYEIAQEPDESAFADGVLLCQTVVKDWIYELRDQFNPTKQLCAHANNKVEIADRRCQFQDLPVNEKRSYWRWYDGSGWQSISASSIIESNFGSQYIVASDFSQEKEGDGLIEFHVCDPRDCHNLAASLKRTLAQCKPAATNGLRRLLNPIHKRSISDSSSKSIDSGNSKTLCEVDSVKETEMKGIVSLEEEDTDSGTPSRSGFIFHYAYERTCDMLLSMTSSKKLLPSMVADETEQLRSQSAGNVRHLIRIFNGLKSE